MAPHVQNPTQMTSTTEAPLMPPPVLAPKRESSPVGALARAVSWEIRRIRTRFTRDNIVSFLKTMRWVAPLTVLVWVYALSEREVNKTGIPVVIDVQSTDPAKLATLVKDRTITCDLTGPQLSLDRFLQANTTSSPIVIQIDTAKQENGEHQIPIFQALEKNKRFIDAGITLTGCSPSTLAVDIDDLVVGRQLPVQKPENSALESATFTPLTVKVSGPKSMVDQMTFVTPDVASLPALNMPGTHTVPHIPLLQPSADHPVNFDPPTVSATLVVKAADIQSVIASVRVWMSVPPSLTDKYKITPSQDIIPKITVIGPPDQINSLSDAHPIAVFEVTQDNINNPGPVPVTITHLPDGVRLVGPVPQISFSVADRTAQ